jgi:hypothetical protein
MPHHFPLPVVNRNTLLIIGNGLNRAVDNNASWQILIDSLIDEAGYRQTVQRAGGLPAWTNLVTLYQELSLHCGHNILSPDLKKCVARNVERFQAKVLRNANLHRHLMSLPCQDICTTNYDYIFEDCTLRRGQESNRIGNHRETQFSLYRHIELPRKRIWHIHGELDMPSSINLGHNQYAGYLHRAREYLVTGFDSSGNQRSDPLLSKLNRKAPFSDESWLDLFFGRPVVWLGFNLAPSEYVLWWLVFMRSEMAQRFPKAFSSCPMIYLDIFDHSETNESKWQREERNRMLRTAGAIVHDRPVTGLGGWEEAYHNVLNELG